MPGDEDPGWAGTPHYQEHQVQDSLNWNNLAVALVGVLCPVIERGGGHAAGVVVFQPPAAVWVCRACPRESQIWVEVT